MADDPIDVNPDAARTLAFGWPPELKHAPGPPEAVGGKFQAACRCGYEGKQVASSPSHAYNATRVHAETENRREAGRPPSGPDNFGRRPLSGAAKKAREAADARLLDPNATPRPAGSALPTPCGCSCGAESKGLFAPGHDSRFKGILKAAHASGSPVPHPESFEPTAPLEIAQFLDDRRGGGTFWQDKVVG